LPRIALSFRQVIAILDQHGFVPDDLKATSHRTYRATIAGIARRVTVASHSLSDYVKPGTLAAIIRQSGLGKKAFR
jgi:predicted RNA binding protein YcfA (HicA-like mRNA interferase family)